MKRVLEEEIMDFYEELTGSNFSKKYPIKFDGEKIIHGNKPYSSYDTLKLISRISLKSMIPYTGDKFFYKYLDIESKLKPENRNQFYVAGAAMIIVKYAMIITAAQEIINKLN